MLCVFVHKLIFIKAKGVPYKFQPYRRQGNEARGIISIISCLGILPEYKDVKVDEKKNGQIKFPLRL